VLEVPILAKLRTRRDRVDVIRSAEELEPDPVLT